MNNEPKIGDVYEVATAGGVTHTICVIAVCAVARQGILIDTEKQVPPTLLAVTFFDINKPDATIAYTAPYKDFVGEHSLYTYLGKLHEVEAAVDE